MADIDKAVGGTADGLVVIRSGRLARQWGLEDPFAEWFVTEAGYKLVRMAKEVDAVYEEFNLARYLYTSSLLTQFASQYEQMVFLGAGFDCRAIGLNGLKDGRARIYQVDTRAKHEQKLSQLKRRGAAAPEWNPHIAFDLREDGLKTALMNEGFDPGKPVLILAEGLVFYLPPDVTARILDPKRLGLTEGSLMIFDCWSAARVKGLNSKVSERIGIKLFQEFPYAVEPEKLREELLRLGYARVQATPLADIARERHPCAAVEDYPLSWWIVEAAM